MNVFMNAFIKWWVNLTDFKLYMLVNVCPLLYGVNVYWFIPKRRIYRTLGPTFTLSRYKFNFIRVNDKPLAGFYSV